jgi:hypothetical protein
MFQFRTHTGTVPGISQELNYLLEAFKTPQYRDNSPDETTCSLVMYAFLTPFSVCSEGGV